MESTLRATASMCAVCFDVLISTLRRENTQQLINKFNSEEAQASKACPLFVTWTIGRDQELRGCIGTFDRTGKIGKMVPKYALISALEDTRFSPVTQSEVQHLSVSVSLLTNFTPIANPLNWEIGRHGIEIKLNAGGRRYSGTFLPEVAEEEGWDQPTTLLYLFQKAGYWYNSNKNPLEIINDLGGSLNVTTYESSKLTMNFQEYLKYKETMGNNQ